MFNNDNTTWKSGQYPLFFGEAPGLYDSINVTHPKLFEKYKEQKATDWDEAEIDLSQARIGMLTAAPETRDVMVENLALQWELDSVASRAIAPLFAPFITNSEFWAAILKNTEIEVLHALTYSEIVRQCIPDPNTIFQQIHHNEAIMGRIEPVSNAFNELRLAGAKYILGLMTEEEAYPIVMMGLIALYVLERGQFVASFPATFAVVDSIGDFQGIGTLIQKIMLDERFVHAEVDRMAIQIEFGTERGKRFQAEYKEQIKELLDAVRNSEYTWTRYLFSNGRKVVNLNETLLTEYIDYEFQPIYETVGLPAPRVIAKNPLKFMDRWMDLNKTQNANQETDQANYLLNIIVDDIGDEPMAFPSFR
jgi:ribonucleoside-diphosphate reductase beta chain